MSTYNKIKSLTNSLFKEELELQQEQREHHANSRQNDLEYEKKSLHLQKQEQELAYKKIEIFKEEEKLLLDDIAQLHAPVQINFESNEELVANRYIYLKNNIPRMEEERDALRAKTLTKTQIILAEFAAMIFFIFILTRLAADNISLLESFVTLSVFRELYGVSKISLFADMVLQDYLIVLAISFIIAVSFKNSEAFFDAKLKTKLLYGFGIGIVGLFISSMLFTY